MANLTNKSSSYVHISTMRACTPLAIIDSSIRPSTDPLAIKLAIPKVPLAWQTGISWREQWMTVMHSHIVIYTEQ